MKKSTNVDLVNELQDLNIDGKYDSLINNAKANRYHDFKNPEDVICGKVELAKDLALFPELKSFRTDVISGAYDEPMDEEDKKVMRQETPHSMWAILGLLD